MKKIILILLIGIFIGCSTSRGITPILNQQAKAEVAGMDAFDLKYDYDFKKAVKAVVEDSCSINSNNTISCY